MYVFRHNLNDTHETNYLNIGRSIIKVLNYLGLTIFKIVDDFEYIIYRAKLDVNEMSRLNVDYELMKSLLVEIEDKSFYTSKIGVSFKALMRGALSQFPYFRKRYNLIRSGGSTITMQLARTLFISTHSHKIKRKFVEVWLSLWISEKFTKEEILNLYIVSVRYDKDVFGLSKAIKHFFGEIKNKKLTREECFVLIERLSNETSTYRKCRVDFLYEKVKSGLDKKAIDSTYKKLLTEKKIKE